MAEALAAAAKALLKKLAVDTVFDKDKKDKFLLIIGSIAVGLLFLLFAPIAVLSSMGEIESPDINGRMIDEIRDFDDEKLEILSRTMGGAVCQ